MGETKRNEDRKHDGDEPRSCRRRLIVTMREVTAQWYAIYAQRSTSKSGVVAFKKRLVFWAVIAKGGYFVPPATDVAGMVFRGESTGGFAMADEALPEGVTFVGYMAPGMQEEDVWTINNPTESYPGDCPIYPEPQSLADVRKASVED